MAASHFLLLLALAFSSAAASVSDGELNDDVFALVVFKSDVSDPRGVLSTWTEDSDRPCGWPGVYCDASSGRVVAISVPSAALSGRLGRALLRLDALRALSLRENLLAGPLPDGLLRHLPALRTLDLAGNLLSGDLSPLFSEFAVSPNLISLNLSANRLSGPLPAALWSLPKLRSLDLSGNEFYGDVPPGVPRGAGVRLLNLGRNRLDGPLPPDIGNATLLKFLDLSSNSFSGMLPDSLGRLASLKVLVVGDNEFTGQVPDWIGALSGLQTLDMSRNRLDGSLPDSIGKCSELTDVDLSRNAISGSLPWWLFGLGLQRVSVADNALNGWIKISGNVSALSAASVVDLSGNELSGEIPAKIGDLKNLKFLNLSNNSFSGGIPAALGGLKSLQVLDLSKNQLNGSIPEEISGMAALQELRLGRNSLAGKIPETIGQCSSLTYLDLSQNTLIGPIPSTIASISGLQVVDLSQNKLTGSLPMELSALTNLHSFNVSHNLLSGDLPISTFFNTISPSSIAGNRGLCGSATSNQCTSVLPKPIVLNPNSSAKSPSEQSPSQANFHHKKIILSISALIAIAGAAAITIGVITITVLNLRVRTSAARAAGAALVLSDEYLSESPKTDDHSGKLVMFGGDHPEFNAGGHALNKDCELGRGGFGTVYKTVLRDGQPVAIKKLTISSLVKSRSDFEREVKFLSKARHHNLIELKGFYWSSSLQLLIYEFVPGGSLHKHLHECNDAGFLSWNDRCSIILGIARGLAHLHRHSMIHYNLKSSNILLTSDGEARVGDYGLAKLLPMLDRYVLSSKVQSALGYMAPEFACPTVKVTEKCDVYGFGVLVLEVLTGRRPVEYLEDDVVVLCDLVRSALDGGRPEECIDEKLSGKFPADEAAPLIKLGLVCTSQVPSNRPAMAEVVEMLELLRNPADSPDDDELV